MDCSGGMAVDAGGAAVGGRGACAWIRLAGAGGGSGARRCLGTPVAWCATDGGWKCRWSVGLFRQSDSGCGDEVDVLPSIVWLFVGG